ncbi:hypothetical protein BC826DRAFT_1145009 [Russula brevipes]|nr:hypothetical protein BC826DRAFT_1145009 [Russula brevipes]
MGALFSFIATTLLLAIFLAFSFSAEASLSAGDNPSISGTGSGTVQNNPGYFLRASHEGSEFRFGVFGYTGTKKIGYHFPVSTGKSASPAIYRLTYTLVLHPIAASLPGLTVAFGIASCLCHRLGAIAMALSSTLATLATLLAFIFDTALFSIARHEFRKLGWSSQYGNAIWLTLDGEVIALTKRVGRYLVDTYFVDTYLCGRGQRYVIAVI